ncbi:hypothetical protein [Phormidesmis priestleyi]|uniref:hypothetical protein n=1 Tax=Phormidesmis priestleyi TaxID=268141 RepID=UPI000AA501D2|nr:hypothetical protein [Phormidesmis priestleyi]
MQLGQTPIRQLTGDGSGYRDRDDQLASYQAMLNFRAVGGKLDRVAPIVSVNRTGQPC